MKKQKLSLADFVQKGMSLNDLIEIKGGEDIIGTDAILDNIIATHDELES